MGAMELEQTISRVSTAEALHVHARTIIVVAAINFAYFAQLVAVVGSGFLAQSIQTFFGGNNESTWFSAAITIFTVVLGPPISQIADLWGRKWPLVFCMMCGFIGSLIASRAESMGTVIAGFCIIGISFGGQALLHAVVSEVLPRKQRPMAQATVNATAGIGAIIGICMGGALLRNNDFNNYRVYMYVLAAIFFAAALGIGLCYNPPVRELQATLTTGEKLRRLDWIGYALFTPGLVLFCVALSWSRNPYPWSSPRIIAPFVVGLIFMIGFFVFEWRFKKDGILNHGLFKDRNFPVALALIFIEGLTFFAANTYFAFEVSVLKQTDLLVAGLHFALTFGTTMVSAVAIGFVSSKFKALKIPTLVGFVFILIFNICMATSTPSTSDGAFWGYAVLLGIGLGIILPTIMVTAQLSTPREQISTASALVVSARSFGGAIGLAINNAIFNSTLATQIPKRIAAAVLPLGLPPSSIGQLIGALTTQDQAALAHVPGASPQIIGAAGGALLNAYSAAFKYAWIAACCFCAVGIIVSPFIRDPKAEFNAHIDSPAEESLIEQQDRIEGARAARADRKNEKVFEEA